MPNLFSNGLKGLADSLYSGIEGSVAKIVGLDLHSSPGLIKIHQALAKDSPANGGEEVTELCRVRLAVSSGETFWFSYTSGKIWRRSTGGDWLLIYTTVGAGDDGCLGAAEYDGYIYWATAESLHRIPIGLSGANIDTKAHWTTHAAAGIDWKPFTNEDAEFHPMVVRGLRLFIGDGNYVSKVWDDDGTHTFVAKALDIKTPLRIKTMIEFDIDLLIGTYVSDYVNKAEIIRWDTYDDESWQTDDTIEENGINAFIKDDNYVYAQCGKYGRIYFYDGARLIPYKRIPGDWSPTKYGEVYPQAVSTLLTIPVFGFSNGAGNPTEQGVYSFGSYSKDYTKVLDLSYPVSAGLSDIEVGAVLAVGADLLVSWYDGTNYGVDKLSYTAKYSSAYIETMVLTVAEIRHFLKSILEIYANYSKLPTGTGIGFKYKKKHEVAFSDAMTVIDDTKLMQVRTSIGTVPDIAALQLRIDCTVQNDSQTFTANATTDVITSNDHGLSDGDIVTVASGTTLPSGLSVNTEYYVITSTTNTFQLSATPGGTKIDIDAGRNSYLV